MVEFYLQKKPQKFLKSEAFRWEGRVSPPAHKEFSTPIGLLEFVQKLRDLSGGNLGLQPVSEGGEFIVICKAMIHTGITPDYIAIDGGEGYRAPAQFSNHVDSLALIRWFCALMPWV